MGSGTVDAPNTHTRTQWQGDWDLRRVVAEVAAQHPDYGGLQAAVREELWDIDYTEHPNTSSRMDLRRFDVRMSTYSGGGWHQSLVSPEELARAGLYYVGMEDRVCCFSCGIQLEEWGEKDPLTRHCLASPHCAFLQQDFPEQLESLRQSPGPQQTQFSNTSHRLHSFANWPLSSVVTSYQLASVGFYYTGEGATVVCFSCGLEVREWQKGDVPLLVHCRSNPECPFIKSIIKGGGPSSEKKQAPTPMMQTLAIDSTSRPDYSDLQVRLQSFKKLSPAFPIPRLQLAEAGLFLLRLPDVMKCHSCGVVLQGWVRGDTAVEKHHGASPHCQFLENRFPCKLTSPSVVDPSSLPAAEFNESELEMMAQQQPSSTSYQQNCPFPSSGSTHESLSLTGLSISDTHTLTASNTTSFIPPASNSLSGLGTSSQAVSGTQELSYSSTAHASTSTTHSASAAQLTPATKLLGGNPVSLPPSHLQALSHSHTTAPEKV